MGYYDLANDHPPVHEPRHPAVMNYGGAILEVPAQSQAAPPAPIDVFHDPARNAAAFPAPVFFDDLPHQGPVPIVPPANEVLRQLAILYLIEPNAHAAVICIERGHAHGVRVDISLDLADL